MDHTDSSNGLYYVYRRAGLADQVGRVSGTGPGVELSNLNVSLLMSGKGYQDLPWVDARSAGLVSACQCPCETRAEAAVTMEMGVPSHISGGIVLQANSWWGGNHHDQVGVLRRCICWRWNMGPQIGGLSVSHKNRTLPNDGMGLICHLRMTYMMNERSHVLGCKWGQRPWPHREPFYDKNTQSCSARRDITEYFKDVNWT